MKWQTILLIMFVLVLTVTTGVFFKDELFNEKVELSQDQQKGMLLLNTALDTCLVGEAKKTEVFSKVKGSLTEGVDAGSGINDVTSKGAVSFLDENIRVLENEKMRDCLEREMATIKPCLMGDCQSANRPKTIDFKFSSPEPNESDSENQYLDTAFFRYQYVPGEKKILKQDDGFFSKTIEMLDEGKTSIAQVSFQVKQGNNVQRLPAKICLQAAKLKPNSPNYVEFNCQGNGQCKLSEFSPKWFDECPINDSATTESAGAHLFSAIFPKAYAQDNNSYWAVPSLETLQARIAAKDLVGIGFTHFTIRSDKPLENDADGFYYDLKVNQQTVLEDSLYSDFNVKEYDPNQAISIDFGLQNLNFSGRINGCDELSVDIQFLKNGKPVGDKINWQRSYVALRDARKKQMKVDDTVLSWQGNYQRADKEYDSEVFISSILIAKNLDFSDHLPAIKKNQKNISAMKAKFDQAGLVFEGKPLVAVIRPPLTQISYGLAVGIVEDTGQIRFTFSRELAKKLKSYMLTLRQEKPEFESIIMSDTFIYALRSAKSYSQSPTVCWDELAI